MSEDCKLIATGVLTVGAALMIMARRYGRNVDPDAGYGIAGWTMFILYCIWQH